MSRQTKILIGILIIGLIGGSSLFVLYILGIIPPQKPTPSTPGSVSISTDKIEYEQGEVIMVTIKNTLDKSIWYKSYILPFCSPNPELLSYDGGSWKRLPVLPSTPSLPGWECPIEMKEVKRGEVVTLEYRLSRWHDIKILKSYTKYKFSFEYSENKEKYKTIYSNEFTIKKQKFSQNVIDLCKKERDRFKNCQITEGCVDGFSERCYFDSTKYKKDELKSGFSLPEETRKVCFAIHSSSACQCFNKFQIKIDNEFKEVSCEEFFQAIEDKNKSCNDCLDVIWAGCC